MKLRQKKKLLKALEDIEDFRRHRDQIVYPLSEILFMALFALIKGDCKNAPHLATSRISTWPLNASILGQLTHLKESHEI